MAAEASSRDSGTRPLALVTGVGRAAGIGAAITAALTGDGWAVATAGWRPYDERMPWGADDAPLAHHEVDLADPDGAARLVDAVVAAHGDITALVMSHTESVDSDIRSTTVESFDRHMAVNARAVWQLVQRFAEQFVATGRGRIVAITSDHTAGNLAYGASKGAMDRIVLAAAVELAELELTANVVNPGATDTAWMTPDIEAAVLERTLAGRMGRPADCAHLVRFLCSDEGGWINGQLLASNGGLRP